MTPTIMGSPSLTDHLKRLAQTDSRGGRVVQRGEHATDLYDCACWSERHTQALRKAFPDAELSFAVCGASLSGFVVRVQRRPACYSVRLWLLALSSCLGASLYALWWLQK